MFETNNTPRNRTAYQRAHEERAEAIRAAFRWAFHIRRH
jgi:hypothetical protein